MDRDHVVEQVRAATDIVELIGSYVELRPAGRDFKGRCPFHQEKTPSFTVSPAKQVFHCFGCGAGGDAFSFIMRHAGLEFRDALRLLARRAGIELPEARQRGAGPSKTDLYTALRHAVRFYRGQLRADAGRAARDYLRQRGLPGRMLDLYYAGYAPGSGHALLDGLSPSHPREVLVAAGLVGQSDSGRLYDRFRDRIVLPILEVGGEPIGFGGRALRKEVEPKYINSPETPVYRKRGELFGLPQARQAIRQTGVVLIVEGYFDVLSLAAAGLHHAVAPCGTSWTEAHTQRLVRLSRDARFCFLFDGDAAGRAAAWRALKATLPQHAEVGVALLPPGQDPDDLVRAGEIAVLQEAVARPATPVAFGIELLADAGQAETQRIAELAEMIAAASNDIARERMIDEAAERTHLPVRVVRQEVARNRGRAARYKARRDGDPEPAAPAPLKLSGFEEAIVRLVQADPQVAGELREAAQGVGSIAPAVVRLLAWIEDRQAAGENVGAPEALRHLEDDLGCAVNVGFLFAAGAPAPDARLREDLIARLREQVLEAELEGLGFRIRSLEGAPGESGPPMSAASDGAGREREAGEGLAELLERKQALASRLAQLRARRGRGASDRGANRAAPN